LPRFLFFILTAIIFLLPNQAASHRSTFKIDHAKGIIVDVEDVFFRTPTGPNDPMIQITPNVTTSQSWIHAHSRTQILSLKVVDAHGEILAEQEIQTAAFRMYTGEMVPGQYYLIMKLGGSAGIVSQPIVIQS
ncbi:MAG: hypothetical protein AAFR59_18655, partial [Bacteroidota bacterium]